MKIFSYLDVVSCFHWLCCCVGFAVSGHSVFHVEGMLGVFTVINLEFTGITMEIG